MKVAVIWLSLGSCFMTGHAVAEPCGLVPELTRVVARVAAADAIVLDDGSEVVLIGALPPVNLANMAASEMPWPPADITRRALETLVNGKAVDLAFSGRRLDRYGRHLAHLFVGAGAKQFWIQGRLIEMGLARAYVLPGNQTCAGELVSLEQSARLAHAGHWATGIFADRSADDPRTLSTFRDSFQTVAGHVDRLDRVRGHRVLQFGPERSDFAVELTVKRGQSPSGWSPEDLVGKRVRVHGWLEGWRRPRMTLDDMRLIEVLEDEEEVPAARPEPQAQTSQAQPIPAAAR